MVARLATGVPVFRPGTPVPGAAAPFQAAPAEGGAHRRDSRLRSSLRSSSIEGVFAEVVTACAGGAVLTGWALHLGLAPALVGLLGALPFLAQLLHLPAAFLTSGLGRRRVAIVAVGLSRLVYLPLAALPFAGLGGSAERAVLLVVAACAAVLGVIGNNAWVAWMGDMVPGTLRGRYFGRRAAVCTLGGALATLGAGVLLDRCRAAGVQAEGLSMLAALATCAGLVTTLLMRRQHEPAADGGREPLDLDAALRPLRDPRARPFLAYQLAWNAAVGVSAAFFAVHELTNLGMGFALVALHGTGVAAARMLAAPLWGRAIDQVGARPVLVLCSFGIPVIPAMWLFIEPGALLVPMVVETVLSGVLWGGHGLAAFHHPLAIAPRRGRAFYLGAFAAAGGLAFALASVAGGLAAQMLPDRLVLLGHPVADLQVLFLLSCAGRLLAATLTLRLAEPGSRPVSSLLALLRPPARTTATS